MLTLPRVKTATAAPPQHEETTCVLHEGSKFAQRESYEKASKRSRAHTSATSPQALAAHGWRMEVVENTKNASQAAAADVPNKAALDVPSALLLVVPL